MKMLWTFCVVLLIFQFCAVSVYSYDFSVWDNPRQCHGDADGLTIVGKRIQPPWLSRGLGGDLLRRYVEVVL